MSEQLRDHGQRLGSLHTQVDRITSKLDEHSGRLRSLEESNAEIKKLLIRALDK